MTGRYFEELEPGLVVRHDITRTVTETDNLLFSALTHNTQPLHIDAEFAAKSIHGQILVNSIFTIGLVCGVAVTDMTLGTTLGNLGFDKITLPNPVFIGDTLRVESEVVDRRESKSRPNAGVVKFLHRGINQRDELVCECFRSALMIKRASAS